MNATESRIAELLPSISKRADEVESGRRLPDDLLDILAGAGCFRLLVPTRHGGDGGSLTDALRVIEELARADGSTAWLVGQVGLADLVFSCFPMAAQEEIYADGPDVVGAGAVAPKGRTTREGDEWRVNGQWPFVTGCDSARWIYLNCVVLDGRTPQMLPNGAPLTRITLFPAAEVEILDTWHVLGLRGTASHDVRVTQRACPDRRGFSLVGDGPDVHRAIFSIAQAGLLIAAVDLGIARGAVDEVAQLAASGKRRSFSSRSLGQSAVFQDRLGEAYMMLRAARALLHRESDAAWSTARAGEVASPLDRACLRATAAQVTALACRAVDTAHALAGGVAVYETSPLQRRLRDLHTATQHFVNGREFYSTVGAILAGEPVDTTMF